MEDKGLGIILHWVRLKRQNKQMRCVILIWDQGGEDL